MNRHVTPILRATFDTIAEAASPPDPDEIVAGARARLGPASVRVTDADIAAAVGSLLLAGFVRVTWDGAGLERGTTPESALTEEHEWTFWRARRRMPKAAR
ncbi:hypothetical protein DMP15_18575 [Pseudonocardia sp. UM4_GMWB1]|jgi:hypothetical protein|uniref:hypothetical protein n=1 Tax=Pseudonocardia sp. UM4_GMWB1 TaxID=2212989 RepID=UPI00307E0EDC